MRRMLSSAASTLPLAALLLGPWLGLASLVPTFHRSELPPGEVAYAASRTPTVRPQAEKRRVGGCNCRQVVVNLRNVVRNAKVRTGDATFVNYSVTYVSAAFGGDREVDVEQEAFAASGDAVAGQLLDVDARGPGCVNVLVRATNEVEDTTVQSGDATAINKSIVLLDPGVHRGDLDIEIDQEAIARTGRAIAGQVMSVIGGPRRGRCGGNVDVRAVNSVRDTKVLTGRARFLNDSKIITCTTVGCAAELQKLVKGAEEVQVCSADGCDDMDTDELAPALAAAARDRAGEDEADEEDEDLVTPQPAAPRECRPQPTASPEPTAMPRASSAAGPSPTPAASPAPSARPAPASCADEVPSPTPSAELLASEADRAPGS